MARLANDFEFEAYSRMSATIRARYQRNHTRTLYADAEKTLDFYRLVLPNGLELEQVPLFWPAKAIDVFSSRLRPSGYLSGDSALLTELETLLEAASADLWEKLAIRSALRHGPAFVFTSLGDQSAGEPPVVVTVSSALSATAEINRVGAVTAALEMLGGGMANLYLPGRVLTVNRSTGRRLVVESEHDMPTSLVQCAPFVHDITTEKPFGSSRITRPIMGITDAGVRTFMRSEVSAEWYMHPRERLLGVDASAFEDAPGWVRTIGGIEVLPDIHPEDEPRIPDSLRRASVHTPPQMSMQPFSDQMRMIAGLFSGAASIPPQYLGIVAESNPQSAQAVWANEIDLVRAVEDQYASFNRGRKALAVNVLSLVHGRSFDAMAAATLKPQWQDAKTRSPIEQGQFVAQQVQVGNFQSGTRATLEQLPIPPEVARLHADENRKAEASGLLDKVLGKTAQPAEDTAPEQ